MSILDEKYCFKQIPTDRGSGILLPLYALPSDYGIGTMGKTAYEFIDFLQEAGQQYWQILPLGPTGYGDSPYQPFSAYAGNPYFIDLDMLKEDKLISDTEISAFTFGNDSNRVDYQVLYDNRLKLLRLAWERASARELGEFNQFCAKQKNWLDDFCLYTALKEDQASLPWQEWAEAYKRRNPNSLEKYSSNNREELRFIAYLQFVFYKQWFKLHDYATARNIKLIGDLPIYVAEDGADTWANPQLFQLDENLTPLYVGGCPPDGFSNDGQLWGNPVYDWEYMEKTNYSWWIDRIAWNMQLFDLVRIDHFRGFESYWRIPYGDKNAKRGSWEPGPGKKLFAAIQERLGSLPILPEDLGYMTKEVNELREYTGLPSMKILQFAFNPNDLSDYLPHNLERNSVIYTGTHDNDTLVGWLARAPEGELDYAKRYLNLTKEEGYVRGMIRGAMSSVSRIAIFQMQDFLKLGNEARTNYPGTMGNNWQWRMLPGQINAELASEIHELTACYGRLPQTKSATTQPEKLATINLESSGIVL